MPFATGSSGELLIAAARTRTRSAVALLPVALLVILIGSVLIYARLWTWPPAIILLMVLGLLLNPATWGVLVCIPVFVMVWDGTVALSLDGRFLVFRRLVWGRGFPHRTDIARLPALSVAVKRYPRDDSDHGWRTSFRPRVIIRAGASTIMAIGEGLSIDEAGALAAAVSKLIADGGGRVEQAHRADAAS